MSRRFKIHRCHICNEPEFEEKMIEYNDHFFCGIYCRTIQGRKDDANLNVINIDRAQLRALGSRSK